MVLRRGIPAAALLLSVGAAGFLAPAARGDDGPRPGQVTLELKDYLSLVEAAERAARERARRDADRTAPLAEVVRQSTAVTFGADGEVSAGVKAEFEILVQGHPKATIPLPARFIARSAGVEPLPGGGGNLRAALAGTKDQLYLVIPEPGRYAVRLEGDARLARNGGVSRYAFAPVAAPVAVAEVELPAELAWRAPGAVVVDERVEGGKRRVRLSAKRGESPAFEVWRKLAGGDAAKLLAKADVLTLFQLGPEGAQRHDVILYEVSRGSLSSFSVTLPPGLEVEGAGTDEGGVIPVVEARELTLHRRNQLQRTGYLVLTSTPLAGAGLTLAPVDPGIEVRARYLAVASTVASEAHPTPEAAWSRVDLQDLPAALREALASLDPTAAWRLGEAEARAGEGTGSRLEVVRVQAAPLLPAVVRSRQTTTVVTVDGTVLHRDRFALYPVEGVAAVLDLLLPPGGVLWSVKVDDQPVRPLGEQGKVSIPLGVGEGGGKGPVVEVVSVLEKVIPKGRSELALALPRLAVPVQDHRWRLLLPEGAGYRFARGDLRPVPGRPVGARTESSPAGVAGGDEALIAVAEAPLLDERREARRQDLPASAPPPPPVSVDGVVVTDLAALGSGPAYYDFDAFEEMRSTVADLRSGLVGGLRSLPISIPENGKLFVMAGLLPPEQVSVTLEVRAKR